MENELDERYFDSSLQEDEPTLSSSMYNDFSPIDVSKEDKLQEELQQPVETEQTSQQQVEQEIPVDEENILNSVKEIDDKILELKNALNEIEVQEKNNFYNNIENDFNNEQGDEVSVYSPNNNYEKQLLTNAINELTVQKDILLNPSVEKAIETEKDLGGDPKLVNTSDLGPVVIDEKQENVKNAIEEHGGLEPALQDSFNNQKNIEEQEFIPNLFFKEEDNNSLQPIENIQQPLQRTDTYLNSNTDTIISLLREIKSELSNIKSNNQTVNNTTTNNNINNNKEFTQPSVNVVNKPEQKESNPINTNIRNSLDEKDFPKGFDMSKFKGNL